MSQGIRALKLKKLFILPPNSSIGIQRVANEFKRQNNLTGFINNFIKDKGFIKWDKAITVDRSAGITSYNTSTATTNSTTEDTTIILPFGFEGINSLEGFIKADLDGAISLYYYGAKDYNTLTFDLNIPQDSLSAQKFSLNMMALEKLYVGTKKFKIIDPNLFLNINHPQPDSTIVSIDSLNQSIVGRLIFVEICSTTTNYHCTHTGDCTAYSCDLCSYCVSNTVSCTMTTLGFGSSSGSGSTGSGSGSGGGTGGSGGGTPANPCVGRQITDGNLPIGCGGGPIGWNGIPENDVSETDIFEFNSGPVIDLQKYKNCFALVNSVGATYAIKICADIPVNNDPHKINTLSNPGHVFMTFTKTNGTNSVTQSFGFYARNGPVSLMGLPVSSKVVNDENHEFNASIKMNVTEANFLASFSAGQTNATSLYDINDYNCAYFALDNFNTIRTTPLYVPDTYTATGAFFGKTPLGLYQTLLYKKTHNDPEKNNIQIGTFFSPLSHGPCN